MGYGWKELISVDLAYIELDYALTYSFLAAMGQIAC